MTDPMQRVRDMVADLSLEERVEVMRLMIGDKRTVSVLHDWRREATGEEVVDVRIDALAKQIERIRQEGATQ